MGQSMKVIRMFLMVVFLMSIGLDYSTARDSNVTNVSTTQQEPKPTSGKTGEDKYLGYSMDGVTSASKLAAQRSHTVAGKDERNFAVFTGITVIFIIFIFTQIKFFDK